MKVRYSYLIEQFGQNDALLRKIADHLENCSFTLGPELYDFESNFAKFITATCAIGVASGTDAIKLALKASGVKPEDEVITAANTFIATAGAITEIGAIPILVDVTNNYTIDPNKIEEKITKKTSAIVPVHLTGEPADMDEICKIASKHNLKIIEDACQSIGATYKGKQTGTFGDCAAFSLHPLKNLNIWGDGGLITTNSTQLADQIKLLRNHGLKTRDEMECFGYNSRLDTIQAIIANEQLPGLDAANEKRRYHASMYDYYFNEIDEVHIPERRDFIKSAFHLYIIRVNQEYRDKLLQYLHNSGIEAKIHYPIPLCLQQPMLKLGNTPGDFPVTESHAKTMITLPVDQYLSESQVEYVGQQVAKFFKEKI